MTHQSLWILLQILPWRTDIGYLPHLTSGSAICLCSGRLQLCGSLPYLRGDIIGVVNDRSSVVRVSMSMAVIMGMSLMVIVVVIVPMCMVLLMVVVVMVVVVMFIVVAMVVIVVMITFLVLARIRTIARIVIVIVVVVMIVMVAITITVVETILVGLVVVLFRTLSRMRRGWIIMYVAVVSLRSAFRFTTGSLHQTYRPQVHSCSSTSLMTFLPLSSLFAASKLSRCDLSSLCICINFAFSLSSVSLASNRAAKLAGRSIGRLGGFELKFELELGLAFPAWSRPRGRERGRAGRTPAAAPAIALNCDCDNLGIWLSFPSALADQSDNAEGKFGSLGSMVDGGGTSEDRSMGAFGFR